MADRIRIDSAEAHRPHFPTDSASSDGASSSSDSPQSDASQPETASFPLEVAESEFGPLEDAGPVYLTEPAEPSDTHAVERHLQQELMAHPEVTFSSLVVRRVDGGVCLQGILEYDETVPDVCSLARRVAGVETVLNRLVVRQSRGVEPPPSAD